MEGELDVGWANFSKIYHGIKYMLEFDVAEGGTRRKKGLRNLVVIFIGSWRKIYYPEKQNNNLMSHKYFIHISEEGLTGWLFDNINM